MSEIHDAGIPSCPGCGQLDAVAAVPAVYLGGRDAIQVAVPARGDMPARTETRQVTTALAEALAPVPADPRGLGGAGALALFVAAAAAGVAAIAPSPNDGASPVGFPDVGGGDVFPDLAWLWWVAGFGGLVGLALFGALAARSLARRGRIAGRAQAEALWARGWYCARCATVHFRAAADVPHGPLPLGEFRRLVWGAGGYADLAGRHPLG